MGLENSCQNKLKTQLYLDSRVTSAGWRWRPAQHVSPISLVTIFFLKSKNRAGMERREGSRYHKGWSGKAILVLLYLVNGKSDGSCKHRLKSQPTVNEWLKWQSSWHSSPSGLVFISYQKSYCKSALLSLCFLEYVRAGRHGLANHQ